MSQQVRPTITNGKTGVGNFGVGVMPDGTSNSLRILITPDGFHFKATDFDDLVLPKLSFNSPKGTKYGLSFDDDGALLINGVKYVSPTNQNDEVINGNKQYEGTATLKGGLILYDKSGSRYSVNINNDGQLIADKETN
ncbi:hypothetical protein EFT43_07830 [Leuconostoc falkenbergense]|uniref:hypothetical protein n=1 Tax=Leuconostoc falkenbergense TaxID=2766470 RepID=UPI0021AA1C6F|nr:hypothetical protein [Leuconostoc falkenbergense]MCT4404806.1 hypothetical protein [Leuconostoc falkenbergense]